MNNYTIAETFELPSMGKIYEYEVNPQVTLKSMTTEQEQKRLTMSDYPYKMLCEIIDDCIVDDIGISSYDMHIGDYQFLLHKLRVVTYGPEYRMETRCPYCGSPATETINLDDLPVVRYSDEFDIYKEFVLPRLGNRITLRIQTPRLLDSITEKSKNFMKKFPESSDPTLTYTIQALIEKIDDKKPDPLKVEQWIKNLPMADANVIISHAEKMNSLLGIDTTLLLTCDVCKLSREANLTMSKEFFRPALNI